MQGCISHMRRMKVQWISAVNGIESRYIDYSSVTSSTRGARSRFTVLEVSGAAVAVVVAEGVDWAVA